MLNTFASLKCSKKCQHTVFSQLNAPGVYLKIGSFDPACNQGPAFNRENTVMYKGLYGACLLNLFASLGDLGTNSQYSRPPCGIQPVYHVLFINL